MQNCKICGLPLPDNASFCGYCGGLINNPAQSVTDITTPAAGSGLEFDTPFPPSTPVSSIAVDVEPWQPDTNVTLKRGWPEGELVQNIPWPEERQGDESSPILPDIILPGMLVGEGQAPPIGNVPMVPGTPQVGGVPTVQGTLSTPPASPSPLHYAPSRAPQMHPVIETQPIHHPPLTSPPHSHPQPPLHHPAPPQHHPQPTPTPPEGHKHHRHHHHRVATHHAHRPHTRWLRDVTSKVVVDTTTKWVLLVVTAILVIVVGGIIVILALPSALSLSGSGTVTAGGTLHLHGKGFLPGGNVTFTLDNGLPVSLINHSSTRTVVYSADRGANSASTLQMLLPGQSVPQAASNAAVSISALGTFDATLIVSTNWSSGLHTIHATERFGSRTADLAFKIIPPPKLVVQQKHFTSSSSDCLVITGSGNLVRGWLCTVTLSTDSSDLSWSASSTDPSNTFTPSKGIVHPNRPESVTIFIPNEPHCSNATFTFAGPTNLISVSWSCPTR